MEEYQALVALVFPLIGLISGAVGKVIVDQLKAWGLKGKARVRPVAMLICSALATALLAGAGVLSWKVAPVVALLAWLTAEAKAQAEKAKENEEAANVHTP